MKSFREWKNFSGRNVLEENLATAMRNFAGGSNLKVDNSIRTGLRSKILQLWRDAQEQGISALDFARQVWASVSMLVTKRSGANLNTSAVSKDFSSPQQQEWNRLSDLVSKELMLEMGGEDEIDNIDLVRILGSSSIRVNRNLEIKLKPKLQQIFKDKDFAEEDPSELLRQVIAVAAKEITGAQGTTLSTQKLARGLGREDDPVAREMP